MASRFVVADNVVIEEFKTSSENLNTRKSTNLLVGVFKKWAGRVALRRSYLPFIFPKKKLMKSASTQGTIYLLFYMAPRCLRFLR
jgi:hypothetical protein